MAALTGIIRWDNLLFTPLWGPEKLTRLPSRVAAARVVCILRGGGIWMAGRLICTTELSFWVKLWALQFYIHMCASNKRPAQIYTTQCGWDLSSYQCHAAALYLCPTFLGTVIWWFWKLYQFKLIARNKRLRSCFYINTHSNVAAYSWMLISCTLIFVCVCVCATIITGKTTYTISLME